MVFPPASGGEVRVIRLFSAVVIAIAAAFTAAAQTSEDPALDPENWRPVDPENLLVFETTKGRILVETAPEASITVSSSGTG